MPSPLEERRPPITPQLAVRVAILGGIAFVLFATIFFRLWFLQVLSGDDYVSQAAQNKFRKIRIDAPRGNIVDRTGDNVLVQSREAKVVQLLPNDLPEVERELAAEYGSAVSASERARLAAGDRLRALDRARRREKRKFTPEERRERRALVKAARKAAPVPVPPIPDHPGLHDLYERLGEVIELRPAQIHRRVIQQVARTPYAAVTVKTDIPIDQQNYLLERKHLFPGVRVEKLYLRDYKHDDLAAHLFGTIGEISPEELKLEDYRGVQQGERIGKSGIEYTYDRYLRGRPGHYRQVVDALGEGCDTCPLKKTDPDQGYRLQLTLDLDLQRAGQNALRRAISAAAINGSRAGAFVAMDPTNGEILAIGSEPSFDANVFAKPISQEDFDRLNSDELAKPLYNRAIAGVYPTGSTFKLITAAAALETGEIDPTTIIHDSGVYRSGDQEFRNAKDEVYGNIDIHEALKVSSDVFFYTLGARMNPVDDPVPKIQSWARKLGLGKTTGIDIPGEFGGLVPDPKWRNEGNAKYVRCIRRHNLAHWSYAALLKCGGFERSWSVGDNIQLAVGQGDLQATPLQMAVAYSAVANGGKVVTPHLGRRVEDGFGRLIAKLDQQERRSVKLSSATRSAILEGLRRAAMEPGGTSADVFAGFPLTVYGKTGTVERPGQADQSWYVAYVNAQNRPIVVAVTVEKGGFGAETAAPAARLILSQWFNIGDKEFRTGKSETR